MTINCAACEDTPAPGNNPCAVCGLEAATALQTARAKIERLREALAILNAAINKARDTVPDDDEGIAARVFCHHLNQAQMDARQALEQSHGQ